MRVVLKRVRYTLAPMGTSASNGVQFYPASDQSLLVYFGPQENPRSSCAEATGLGLPTQNQITTEGHESVRRLLQLMELEPIAGVRNLHPAYCSLLIKFDALKLRHEELEEILRGYVVRMEKMVLPVPRLVEIPVCYGGEYGPDLKDVAELHGITTERVIELHATTTYTTYFLGFAPGFAYLGQLPEALATPRLALPRKFVPIGSVGIAGRQTGVYPISTPGGWRLLGRTPLAMFRLEREEMSLLSIGDRVQFVPISREQFAKLENA
ncbi:MAG: 5-oxoprolinase subunit PxpB [Candidatus Acidiferrum sp.]